MAKRAKKDISGNADTSSVWWEQRPWMPWLLIVCASAMAHIWCLGSQFYLDDIWQIRDNTVVREGAFLRQTEQMWTYFWYVMEARASGMSPVAFHAVNWLLHTGVACVLYASARDYLRGRGPRGAALFGAVLFVVHPLGSEIPNYARAQDLAWVTLFSLTAAWLFFRFLRDGGWAYVIGTGLCIVGAAISKGPGLIHALMMTGVVGLAFLEPRHLQDLRRMRVPLAGAACIVGLVLWWLGCWQHWLMLLSRLSQPRIVGFGFTVCRVFWEFAWRAVVPVQLSADHHIAETLQRPGAGLWGIGDSVAWWAAVGIACFTACSLVLAWRKSTRLVGVCMFLFAGAMLMRVFYYVAEFMPEYRIYPGLPWFCLGAAILLAQGWRGLGGNSGRVPAVVLVLVFAALSAKRSFLWHDLDRLMADVLEQYPTQARAVWILQQRDLEEGRWQAVIDRHRTVFQDVRRRFLEENRNLKPDRELPTGHLALAEVGCGGIYAQALARQRGPQAGLNEINRLEDYMKRLQLDPLAHSLHWSYFYHAKGLVLETAGDYKTAAEFLRMGKVANTRKLDLERVEAKIR